MPVHAWHARRPQHACTDIRVRRHTDAHTCTGMQARIHPYPTPRGRPLAVHTPTTVPREGERQGGDEGEKGIMISSVLYCSKDTVLPNIWETCSS